MKKLISLFLMFSILLLSGSLFAKERKGVELVIQKTDGAQVRGELIAVKEDSLLMLERDSGADMSVDIENIKVVKIVKKSMFWRYAGYGFLIGAGIGALIGSSMEEGDDSWIAGPTVGYTIIVGVPAAILSGIIAGTATGTAKIIWIEGKSDSEIQEILEKFRKKSQSQKLSMIHS